MAEPEELIHAALEAAHADVFRDAPAMLVGWVVIAEFANDDGSYDLCRTSSDGLPTWRRSGFLWAGLEGGWDDDDPDDDEE